MTPTPLKSAPPPMWWIIGALKPMTFAPAQAPMRRPPPWLVGTPLTSKEVNRRLFLWVFMMSGAKWYMQASLEP